MAQGKSNAGLSKTAPPNTSIVSPRHVNAGAGPSISHRAAPLTTLQKNQARQLATFHGIHPKHGAQILRAHQARHKHLYGGMKGDNDGDEDDTMGGAGSMMAGPGGIVVPFGMNPKY